MSFTVRFSAYALKQLSKLDKPVQRLILNWLKKHIEGTANPRIKGKGLVGDRSGEWRYRVGDYRIIADIQDEVVTVLVIAVGHRNYAYL